MCKTPELPPTPTAIEPPKAANDAVTRAGGRARDRLRSQSGRSGTILTQGGAGGASTGSKSLLGG